MNERVPEEGHHFVVYHDEDARKGISCFCPQCGLRHSTGLVGLADGVSEWQAAKDAVRSALRRIPVRDCLLVKGWLLVREVMET